MLSRIRLLLAGAALVVATGSASAFHPFHHHHQYHHYHYAGPAPSNTVGGVIGVSSGVTIGSPALVGGSFLVGGSPTVVGGTLVGGSPLVGSPYVIGYAQSGTAGGGNGGLVGSGGGLIGASLPPLGPIGPIVLPPSTSPQTPPTTPPAATTLTTAEVQKLLDERFKTTNTKIDDVKAAIVTKEEISKIVKDEVAAQLKVELAKTNERIEKIETTIKTLPTKADLDAALLKAVQAGAGMKPPIPPSDKPGEKSKEKAGEKPVG